MRTGLFQLWEETGISVVERRQHEVKPGLGVCGRGRDA